MSNEEIEIQIGYSTYRFESVDELAETSLEVPVGVIGGFGGSYDDACWTIMLRILKYLRQNNIEFEEGETAEDFEKAHRDELSELVEDIAPSGAMFNSSLLAAAYIHTSGWDAWTKKYERSWMWNPHLEWTEAHREGRVVTAGESEVNNDE